jgi:sporulation protein YlmC with PRC-barrel domain
MAEEDAMAALARNLIYCLVMLVSGAWAAGASKDEATWLDMRASELIGKHVANPDGKSLGKIEDLIVDMKGAHIPHVVLSFGGIADIGDKLFVFPVNAFTRDEHRDRIVVNVAREQLSASSGFDRSNWPFQPPLARASELRGRNVKDAAGKAVGEIEDVIVNLDRGEVRGVVLAQDGRKADEPKLTVPLTALSVPGERGSEVTLKHR